MSVLTRVLPTEPEHEIFPNTALMIPFGARREVKRCQLSDPEFTMSQSVFPTLSHTFRVWDRVSTLNFP